MKKTENLTAADAGALSPSKVDQVLIQSAITKLKAGQKLSREEGAAFRRYEKTREEQSRWAHYHSIPVTHWQKLFGASHRVIHEMGAAYGLAEMTCNPVNLEALAHELHAMLKKYGPKMMEADDEQDLDAALKREKLASLRRRGKREDGNLIDAPKFLSQLTMAQRLIRGAGTTLAKEYGEPARKILNDALDAAGNQIKKAS
ncbi:MAG: hypothetical protein NTX50_12825 [Candidatus Sumerlaeota bacterium]|nr:hypothetical protein [Candidatus Sumerlaeota bacterium]